MNRFAKQLRLLFPLYNEELHLFARKDIQRVADLDGKRVIIGKQGSGTWLTAHNVLRILKVQPTELIQDPPSLEAMVAILKGRADAMFNVVAKPAQLVMRICHLQDHPQTAPLVQEVHLVPLPPEKGLQEYGASTIGPADYEWLTQMVPTITVKAVLTRFDGSRPKSPRDHRLCDQLAALGQAVRDNIAVLQQTGHRKWQKADLQQKLAFWTNDSCSRSMGFNAQK